MWRIVGLSGMAVSVLTCIGAMVCMTAQVFGGNILPADPWAMRFVMVFMWGLLVACLGGFLNTVRG